MRKSRGKALKSKSCGLSTAQTDCGKIAILLPSNIVYNAEKRVAGNFFCEKEIEIVVDTFFHLIVDICYH